MNVAFNSTGMRKRGKQNLDTLTYDPSGKPAKRQAAGCVTGYCNYKQTNKTCDEVNAFILFASELAELTSFISTLSLQPKKVGQGHR
jgi:hypothetical protein